MTLPTGVVAKLDRITPYGIVLSLFPSDSEFAMEIQRAPDDGFGDPDTGSAATIGYAPPNAENFIDVTGASSDVWHYRARHVRDNYTEGDWTVWVAATPKAIPTILPPRPPTPNLNGNLEVDPLSGAMSVYLLGPARAKSVRWFVETDGTWPDLSVEGACANLDSDHAFESVDFAVLGVSEVGKLEATFYDAVDCGGNVIGTVRDIATRGDAAVDCFPSLDEDDGVLVLVPFKAGAAEEVFYYVETDGSIPTEGEVLAGTPDAGDTVNVHTFTNDLESVWVGVIAVKDRGLGTEVTGPLHVLPYTYHAANDRPMVTWRKAVPSGTDPAGTEAIELVATDDSASVALYERQYNEGDTPGAFTRHPSSGYDPDPLAYTVEVTRPAEGGTPVIVEAYAEDSDGNESAQHLKLRVDGDVVPSGIFTPLLNQGTGIPGAVPASVDPDSGSWRLRVVKQTIGGGSEDTFADPAFSDVASDEFSGNTFGSPLNFTDFPLKKDEVLNVSGYFFRTTSAVAGTQQTSTRSKNIRLQIKQGMETANRIKNVSVQVVVDADDSTFSGWSWALDISLDSGVASLDFDVGSWIVVDDSGPPPWSPGSPTTPYSYSKSASGTYQDRVQASGGASDLVVGKMYGTTLDITPKDSLGVAGETVTVELPGTYTTQAPGSGVTVQNEEGGGVSGRHGADLMRVGAGLTVDTTGGRPRIALKYTVSTSDPSGTPDDGDLWFKVDP